MGLSAESLANTFAGPLMEPFAFISRFLHNVNVFAIAMLDPSLPFEVDGSCCGRSEPLRFGHGGKHPGIHCVSYDGSDGQGAIIWFAENKVQFRNPPLLLVTRSGYLMSTVCAVPSQLPGASSSFRPHVGTGAEVSSIGEGGSNDAEGQIHIRYARSRRALQRSGEEACVLCAGPAAGVLQVGTPKRKDSEFRTSISTTMNDNLPSRLWT
eukprot:766902-Hanusia_phi.AAC.3